MGKLKILFLVLLVITIAFCATVAYAFAVSDQSTTSDIGKRPCDYGVLYVYVAEEEKHPGKWYTPEQLGIVIVPNEKYDFYNVYVVDPEKAVPWMKEGLDADVKYNDKYYWVYPAAYITPGPLYYLRDGTVVGASSSVLAVCWCLLGFSFWKRNEKQ